MDESNEVVPADYPEALRQWAGNQSGGVRRLFHESSGRPIGRVLQTHLLKRLHDWTAQIGRNSKDAPRVVLLVGGPGNGKTEAIESTIDWLDEAVSHDGAIREKLREQLRPNDGIGVPRVARVNVDGSITGSQAFSITVVQDASIESEPDRSRAGLLVGELVAALQSQNKQDIYLSCVNRGVLDDAMVHVSENGPPDIRELLHAVISAVGQSGSGTACWPLSNHPSVAVWPMDVESILIPTRDGDRAPTREILDQALEEARWKPVGQCDAKDMCPFCRSRQLLAGTRGSEGLLSILRWHELATAKRWTFRDFFSLISYLLAGSNVEGRGMGNQTPCEWAASLVALDAERLGQKPDARRSTAIFTLASMLYQHQLFATWDPRSSKRLREDIRELGLGANHTAMGLYHFLNKGRGMQPPAMISGLLASLCDALDPALADPELEVAVSASKKVRLRDVDVRFSQSVVSGRDYLARSKFLSPSESELIGRLAELDRELSTSNVRRRRPDSATRIQHLIRDFSCRWVRRSLGARASVAKDCLLLSQYQRIVEEASSDGDELLKAARNVARLLNTGDKFEVPLSTTFGQPLPPPALRAVLVTTRQPVKPWSENLVDRPRPPTRYLKVGKGSGQQPIALTFELYRAIELISEGLSPASLPREVNALIDATKARLSGPIVRDQEGLDDAVIELGNSGLRIEVYGGQFLASGGSVK